MTQALVLPYGPQGYQVESIGPEGPVRAMLGSGAGPIAPAVLAFNTITAGAAGSGRLIDIPSAQLTALPTGTLAYTGNSSGTVPSVHSYWRLLNPAPSSVSSDSITILKPLGGASRIVWVRVNELSNPYWSQRLTAGTVVVDTIAGSDENFGTVAAPLASEAEKVRRTGPGTLPTFVFRPGASSVGGNVYADWAQLVAAAALVDAPKTIIFDDSLAACNVPVGAWDFGEGCAFVGLIPPNPITSSSTNRVDVNCPDGVTFTTTLYSIRDIRLTYSGTHHLMEIPGDNRITNVFCYGLARLNATGAAGAIFGVAGGAGAIATLSLVFYEYARAFVSGGGFIFDATSGTAIVELDANGLSTFTPVVPANSCKGVALTTGSYTFTEAFLGLVNTTQGSMPGGVVTLSNILTRATNLAYTPASGANWTDPDPTTVQSALDRIANVVAAGGATPIP